MYIVTSAVGNGLPVGERNATTLISSPDESDSCTLQSDGYRTRIP
jgi:hypothetical protein